MFPSATKIILFSATLAVASAQSGDIFHGLPISDSCKSAVLALNTSSVSTCLDIPQFFNILATDENVSWFEPITSWLTKGCGLADCDTAALSDATVKVTNACLAELDLIGFGEQGVKDIQTGVPTYFKTAKNIACLRDQTNSNSLCVRDIGTKLQESYGVSFKPVDLYSDYVKVVGPIYTTGKYPTDIICSKCAKGVYAQLESVVPRIHDLDYEWNTQCGANWTTSASTDVIPVTGEKAVALGSSGGTTAPDNTGGSNGSERLVFGGFYTLAVVSVVTAGIFVLAA